MATIQSPQGSRAGLITALVIFVILFVTSLIFAIYFRVEMQKTQEGLDNTKKTYLEIISPAGLAGNPDIDKLKLDAKDPTLPYVGSSTPMKAIEVAIAKHDAVAKLIGPQDYSQSAKAANAALTGAATTLDAVKPAIVQPTDTLTAAIGNLANAIVARENQISDLKKQVDAAKKQASDAVANAQKQVEAANANTESVRVEAGKTLTDATAYQTTKQALIDELEKTHKAQLDAAAAEASKKDQLIADKDKAINDRDKEIEKQRAKVAGNRGEVSGPIIRAVDANIIRIAGNGVVYINLGAGDQVTPGLTFQVYDKAEGVPPMRDGLSEENMPIGKGSIEVIRVGSTSSECRVLKVTPGATFSEGDLLVNLVYDKNVKYRFLVHGDFDLDQDGRATPGDAEIIKRLVTQWGAKITDKIDIDTDFIVLGKEPAVPNYSKDELLDPTKQKIAQDAATALEAYNDVRQKARDLHIPVLNQNRFLYYVGYYEQAKR